MDGSSGTSKTVIWSLVLALGLGSIGLFAFAVLRSKEPPNLAGPIATSGVRRRYQITPKEKSTARKRAEKESKVQRERCTAHHHDCKMACAAYPSKDAGQQQCLQFCQKTRDRCLKWAHN